MWQRIQIERLARNRLEKHNQKRDLPMDVSHALMEELLESFATACLGLTLNSRFEDVSGLPEVRNGPSCQLQGNKRVCTVWHTPQGQVVICATYSFENSKRMDAHVLWLEWWIPPDIHHEGWWRVERKWPRDWVKGQGTPHS